MQTNQPAGETKNATTCTAGLSFAAMKALRLSLGT